MDRKQKIHSNLLEIQANIKELATKPHVDLVAVTKYGDYSDVQIMYELGHRDFGENRVEELLNKDAEAKLRGHNDIRWHFLGQIQSNKIGDLLSVSNLETIHSLSDFSHFKKIHNKLISLGRTLNFYLQVNTSHEDEKSGLESIEQVCEFIEKMNLDYANSPFRMLGLMTMGKIRSSDVLGDAKKCFSELVQIDQSLNLGLKFSMGMSGDYKTALEQGSDCVRIGSILFK